MGDGRKKNRWIDGRERLLSDSLDTLTMLEIRKARGYNVRWPVSGFFFFFNKKLRQIDSTVRTANVLSRFRRGSVDFITFYFISRTCRRYSTMEIGKTRGFTVGVKVGPATSHFSIIHSNRMRCIVLNSKKKIFFSDWTNVGGLSAWIPDFYTDTFGVRDRKNRWKENVWFMKRWHTKVTMSPSTIYRLLFRLTWLHLTCWLC